MAKYHLEMRAKVTKTVVTFYKADISKLTPKEIWKLKDDVWISDPIWEETDSFEDGSDFSYLIEPEESD